MAKHSRPQIIFLIIFVLVLAFLAAGRVYYQTTAYFEDELSFTSFEQADFPDWAYCDRGEEYLLSGEDSGQGVTIFRDRKGRPLEGLQSISIEIMRKREWDGPAQILSIGLRKARANFVNGVLEGPLEVFHENNKVALQCPYHAGLRNGICKSYATSGWLMNEVDYIAGKPTGVFKSYREDNTLLSDGQAEFCQEYSIDGKSLSKRVFKDKADTWGCTPNHEENIHEGKYVSHKEYLGYWKDGSIVKSASIWEYYSGLVDHPIIYREMVNSGRMFRQETFLWDLHVVQDFDESGVLRRELHDRQGSLEGSARWYDKSGLLRMEGAHKNKAKDGLFRWYEPDGKLVWMAFYSKGSLLGEESFYSLLNWVIFLIITGMSYVLAYPLYVWLRNRIKPAIFSYLVVLLLMFGVLAFAICYSYWIRVIFYS